MASLAQTGKSRSEMTSEEQLVEYTMDCYAELTKGSYGEWVGLAELRKELKNTKSYNRSFIDRMWKSIDGQKVNGRRCVFIPEANRKTLTDDDHEAALIIGGEEQHLMMFEKKSPRER